MGSSNRTQKGCEAMLWLFGTSYHGTTARSSEDASAIFFARSPQ